MTSRQPAPPRRTTPRQQRESANDDAKENPRDGRTKRPRTAPYRSSTPPSPTPRPPSRWHWPTNPCSPAPEPVHCLELPLGRDHPPVVTEITPLQPPPGRSRACLPLSGLRT